jgi:hypothetical protein
MTYPVIPPKQIPCGSHQDFVILDDDGKLKKVRIEAGVPTQGSAQWQPPTPPDTPPGRLPVHPWGTASLLTGNLRDLENVFSEALDADVVLMSRSPRWETAARRRVSIRRVTVADDGQIPGNLPDELRNTSGELLFVPDVDHQ